MSEKGFAADWMIAKDWISWIPGVFMKMTDHDRFEISDLEDRVERFFLTMTKHEIYEETLKRRILLAPVANVADIAHDEQLKAREYFVEIEHDTVGRKLTLPGPFAKLSVTPVGPYDRAPRIGEHNREVFGGLLGLSDERVRELQSAGAI